MAHQARSSTKAQPSLRSVKALASEKSISFEAALNLFREQNPHQTISQCLEVNP